MVCVLIRVCFSVFPPSCICDEVYIIWLLSAARAEQSTQWNEVVWRVCGQRIASSSFVAVIAFTIPHHHSHTNPHTHTRINLILYGDVYLPKTVFATHRIKWNSRCRLGEQFAPKFYYRRRHSGSHAPLGARAV